MAKDDGGPAFPSSEVDEVFVEEFGRWDKRLGQPTGGMSLRDYFAAKALAGMMADSSLHFTPEQFAQSAYLYADAMIERRVK